MGLMPTTDRRVAPVGSSSEDGWLTTRLDFAINWARAG